MLIDTLYSQYKAGGWILIPIFFTGAGGFYLLAWNLLRLGKDIYLKDYAEFMQKFQDLLESKNIEGAKTLLKSRPGVVSTELLPALDYLESSKCYLRNFLQERMLRILNRMDRGMHFVSVLAATAPLLGLLGTVSGMVSTFEIITLYGNSNPVLMADGISEALITTQSGLVIAFPLVLLKQRVDEKINYLREQMELGATIILNQNDCSME